MLSQTEGKVPARTQVHGRTNHCGSARADAGAKTADLARKHGISEATLYKPSASSGLFHLAQQLDCARIAASGECGHPAGGINRHGAQKLAAALMSSV